MFVPVICTRLSHVAHGVVLREPEVVECLVTRFATHYMLRILSEDITRAHIRVGYVPLASLPYDERVAWLTNKLRDPSAVLPPQHALTVVEQRAAVDFAVPYILEDTFFTAR